MKKKIGMLALVAVLLFGFGAQGVLGLESAAPQLPAEQPLPAETVAAEQTATPQEEAGRKGNGAAGDENAEGNTYPDATPPAENTDTDVPAQAEEPGAEFVYDTAPESAEAVAAIWLAHKETGAALPRWENAIAESWLPEDATQREITDAVSGAVYWQLASFMARGDARAIAPMAFEVSVDSVQQLLDDIAAKNGSGNTENVIYRLSDSFVMDYTSHANTVALAPTFDVLIDGSGKVLPAIGAPHFTASGNVSFAELELEGGGGAGGIQYLAGGGYLTGVVFKSMNSNALVGADGQLDVLGGSFAAITANKFAIVAGSGGLSLDSTTFDALIGGVVNAPSGNTDIKRISVVNSNVSATNGIVGGSGTLTIDESRFEDINANTKNVVAFGAGGGSIQNSSFHNIMAGNALRTAAATTITNVQFELVASGTALSVGAGANITVTECLFKDNTGGRGSAICFDGGALKTVHISNSSFIGNRGTAGGYHGGAISADQSGTVDLKVEYSYFKGNFAPPTSGSGKTINGGIGGGIGFYRTGGTFTVDHCVFEENETQGSQVTSDGGAIAVKLNFGTGQNDTTATFAITNSTFMNNLARDDAGAILVEGGAGSLFNPNRFTTVTGHITNCTFYGNKSLSEGAGVDAGSAVQVGGTATTTIDSCTFYNNHNAGGAGALGAALAIGANPTTNMRNTLFVGNESPTESEKNQNVSCIFANGGGNTGVDNGNALPAGFSVDTVLGSSSAVPAENGVVMTTGCAGYTANILTMWIAPAFTSTATLHADGGGTATNVTAADQRGKARGAAPDSGAVDIAWVKFDANTGSWTQPSANYAYASPLLYTDGVQLIHAASAEEDKATAAFVAADVGGTIGTAPVNPTHEAKDFVCWTTTKDDLSTRVTSLNVPATGQTLYAYWQQSGVELEYNNGLAGALAATTTGGVHQPAAKVRISDISSVGIAALDWLNVNPGFSFNGWLSNEASPTVYQSGVEITMPTDTKVVLTVLWAPNSAYRVTYVGNGHDGGTLPAGSNVVAGTTYTVLPEEPSRAGYTFDGWHSDNDNLVYDAGDTFVMPRKAVTLTAQWTENTRYNITYAGNGHTGGTVPSATTALAGSLYTVASGEPTRTGYTFIGWKSSDDGALYEADDTFVMPERNVTLTAEWKADAPRYTVRYNGAGNTGGTVPQQSAVDANTTYTVKQGSPEKTGWAFAGWKSSADGKVYKAGGTFKMPAENVVLTAQYVRIQYRLTFNYNGAGPNLYRTLYAGDAIVRPDAPQRPGYRFGGWKDEAGKLWNFETGTMPARNLTLTAVWTPQKYTVTYISDGQVVGSETLAYDDTVPYKQPPSRDGHTFGGWQLQGADGRMWNFESDRMPAHDITLVAIWTPVGTPPPPPPSSSAPRPTASRPAASSRQTASSRPVSSSDSAAASSRVASTEVLAPSAPSSLAQMPAASSADPTANLGEEDTPRMHGPFASSEEWALLNLILAILALLCGIVLLVGAFAKGKQRAVQDEERAEQEETQERGKRGFVWRILGIVMGVFSPIVFLLTEDIFTPMVIVDRWTLLMVALAVVQAIFCLVLWRARRAYREETPDDDDTMGGPYGA